MTDDATVIADLPRSCVGGRARRNWHGGRRLTRIRRAVH